jgi:hypothetical protein
MQQKLVFLISAPRSGSTLLARMLGAHPAIFAPAEPHLMPPLAHLGLHERVDEAPYDPVVTQRGLQSFVSLLPGGEADWWDALRAAADTLYGRALGASGRALFLDKTPAYALVLPFLARLYPEARYIVLTRHPVAVWSSYVDSFFDGDPVAAHARNPVLERYVPAIARFLREQPVPLRHVRYEAIVAEPQAELAEICGFLGIAFDPAMVEYGAAESAAPRTDRALGDPVGVDRETRPTTRSVSRWVDVLQSRPALLASSREIVGHLADEDLATWGYPPGPLRRELAALEPRAAGPSPARRSRYALERRMLVLLRRNIHHNALGRLVRRVRTLCDVLLR